MIKIYPPQLFFEDQNIKISASFERDNGTSGSLWYQLDEKYKEFVVTERLDTFLVGLLSLGLKTGEDIHVHGSLSKQLHYSLNKYFIKAICLANDEFSPITVSADYLDDTNLNEHAVAGTGLSCGVDSFATYFDHLAEMPPFAIEYFTFFNVGSHGDFGGEKARRIYNSRYEAIQACAKEMSKEIIKVDSNLSEILRLNFQRSHTLRNVSCVLLFQKLFRYYYYASAYRFDFYSLDGIDSGNYDILTLNLLSTESIRFYSSGMQWKRTDKTYFISKFPQTYTYLDVCTNPEFVGETRNCSTCDKCMRTALTLELHGKLENYSQVFSIKKFRKNKKNYIIKLLLNKGSNRFNEELLQLLSEKEAIKIEYSFLAFLWKLKIRLKNLLLKN